MIEFARYREGYFEMQDFFRFPTEIGSRLRWSPSTGLSERVLPKKGVGFSRTGEQLPTGVMPD
ncbi:hypothetical protein [Tahibacter sp.]|uniref:hypothetical protein n=1 Tax=Tahibacter sp. TaxID=2056211 RepID=UPI0028C463D0|nr:hypothetical protein [Tahibacter sp.]